MMKNGALRVLAGVCCLMGCARNSQQTPDPKQVALQTLAQSDVRIETQTIDGREIVKGFRFYKTGAGAEELDRVRMFTEISSLDLGDVNLNDDDLWKLASLTNLVDLDIQGTQVTDNGFRVISKFKKLRSLDARHISVSDEALRCLQEHTELEELSIGAPPVSDEGLAHLRACTKMRRLCISGQSVTDKGIEALAGMTNLTSVYIGHCQVTGEGLKHLQSSVITTLYLQDAKVNEDGVLQVATFPRLERLILSHNALSANTLAPLAREGVLPALKHLDVSCSKVGDEELAHLGHLPSLESLSLEHTEVSQEAAKQFAKRKRLKVYGP
jgi:Leucine-rich repeat (LRR) protein